MSFSDPRLFDRASLLSSQSASAGRYVSGSFAKRCLDVVLAILFLGAMWPLICAIALALYLFKDGPMFNRTAVIGRDGVEFDLLHFQASKEHAFGRWLASSTLSELPQLWAVLLGKMSFVGPRPLELQELGRFRKMAGLYMKARPGLSGPWRVGQERSLGAIAQARLDRAYIKNANILSDLGIILRTPFVLMRVS